MLFPVWVDDAVMEAPQPGAADIRRTRHIGDFRRWKDHDTYQKRLEKAATGFESRFARLLNFRVG